MSVEKRSGRISTTTTPLAGSIVGERRWNERGEDRTGGRGRAIKAYRKSPGVEEREEGEYSILTVCNTNRLTVLVRPICLISLSTYLDL
jgi:hypothetical protein